MQTNDNNVTSKPIIGGERNRKDRAYGRHRNMHDRRTV